MVVRLILTTVAGEETQLTIDLQEYDRLYQFENAVLEQLPNIGESSAFGCELDFVRRNTRQKLVDPIWNTLRDSNCFTVIARPCFAEAEHKGQVKGDAKAIRVPFHTADRILPQAFSYNPEVRRVQVEAGIRIIGEAAWRNCQRLQIVHLSSTVICLQNRVFRRCYALRTVLAPGCKQFGIKVFEECCSLLRIGTNRETTNQLAPQAQLMPRAFEKCTALRRLNLGQTEYDPANLTRCLPECCFLEAGIGSPDFTWIGPAACERCLQLQRVDLSRTEVTEIMGSAFAHCKHLQRLSLPHKLRFLMCTSLKEAYVPLTLLYIARRACAGCAQLCQFHRVGKSVTWRGTYSRANAFLKCDNLDKPKWVRILPLNRKDEDKWTDDSYAEPSQR